MAREFAIHAMNIVFAVELFDWERPRVRKVMPPVNDNHHLLAKQRNFMNVIVRLFAWNSVNDDVKIAG